MRTYSPNMSLYKTYSFGSPLIGRTYQADTLVGNRFGMNTQEKDDEIYGKGNASSAEFWEYDSRLGRRWNLDPKPQINISDYACFNNNPILLTDALGDKVKYNSFTDRLVVTTARIFNKEFRKNFKALKNSDETYNFRKVDASKASDGVFGTDGKNLFVNYIFSKPQDFTGENRFSSLRHETTHGAQFEYGEIGFDFNSSLKKWEGSNTYDMYDEIEAHDNQYENGRVAYFDNNTSRTIQTNASYYNNLTTNTDKILAIYKITDVNGPNSSQYRNLPLIKKSNTNLVKLKTATEFKLPHRIR